MDIKMPNLDGLEATKIIRELSATVPIIAQSAFAYEQDRKAAEEAGCNDFIAKPIADDKLKGNDSQMVVFFFAESLVLRRRIANVYYSDIISK